MKRNQVVFALMILLALMLVSPGGMWAQNTATLSGAVTDPQGRGLQAAKLTLTNKGTGTERALQSGDDGRYTFVSVAPGTYRMRVEAGAGFSVFVREDLR